MPNCATPVLLQGGTHVDARGVVSFVNTFDFDGVDRFYWVRAARANLPRGWVGHQRDHKWFAVIQGKAIIAVVRPDNWSSPSRELEVLRYTLSAEHPQVLRVPPGYATASVNLTANTILMIFSSGRIEDASTDDFRYPVDYWPVLT